MKVSQFKMGVGGKSKYNKEHWRWHSVAVYTAPVLEDRHMHTAWTGRLMQHVEQEQDALNRLMKRLCTCLLELHHLTFGVM